MQQQADDRRLLLPVALQHLGAARLGQQVCGTAKQAKHHKQPYGQKRQQLDQRLKGNRQHHAPVMLGHIQTAGTKQHGKQRQHQRHHQRGIFRAQCAIGRHSTARRTAEQAVAQHNALELQGNVGQHRDQTEQ